MAHPYDVSVKTLFLREGNGIIRRLLFGGKVIEFLATEQPKIFNQRADIVVRTEDRSLRHVELQATNETGFALRMLEYYAYLCRLYKQHIAQGVLYLGAEPLRLESSYHSPSIDFRFEIVNLREIDAEPLLASDDWADNALALLAKGEPEKALNALLPKLRAMKGEDQNWAAGTLLLLSGILGLEETVGNRLKEVGMINVMENKVLGPMILQAERKGRSEGQHDLFQEMLSEKFGPLPVWALQRLQAAADDEFHIWAKRILSSTTLEDTLR
ncbi:MAG: hypothetical protein EXQ57_04845 [Bryobacterales bacterium]|nr:hypothetical protein [Bryobacterales bacterium]